MSWFRDLVWSLGLADPPPEPIRIVHVDMTPFPPTPPPEKRIKVEGVTARGLLRLVKADVLMVPVAAFVPYPANFSEVIRDEHRRLSKLSIFPQLELTIENGYGDGAKVAVEPHELIAWILFDGSHRALLELTGLNASWSMSDDGTRVIVQPSLDTGLESMTIAGQHANGNARLVVRVFLNGSALQGSDCPLGVKMLDVGGLRAAASATPEEQRAALVADLAKRFPIVEDE